MPDVRNLCIAYGTFLFRYRNYIFPLVLIIIVVATTPGTAVFDLVSTVLGISITLSGQSIRAAVIGLDYIKRGGINKQVAAEALVMTGIFAHSRNPLYVGNLLILTGLLVLYNNLWAGIAGTVFFLVSYSAIIMTEEKFLVEKFGDVYRDYCSKVPRWRLRLTGLYSTVSGNRFNWRRVISKDYTTMTTWMISLVLLLADKSIHLHANQRVLVTGIISAVAVITILAFAYSIKRLKNSGYFAGV